MPRFGLGAQHACPKFCRETFRPEYFTFQFKRLLVLSTKRLDDLWQFSTPPDSWLRLLAHQQLPCLDWRSPSQSSLVFFLGAYRVLPLVWYTTVGGSRELGAKMGSWRQCGGRDQNPIRIHLEPYGRQVTARHNTMWNKRSRRQRTRINVWFDKHIYINVSFNSIEVKNP